MGGDAQANRQSVFGGTGILDGGRKQAIKSKQSQRCQVVFSTVWEVKEVSAGKLRGN